MSKDLSNQPLSAIPSDRVAKLSGGDDAQSGCRRRARRDEQREEAASNTLAVVEDLLELGTAPEPPALVERPRRHVRTGTHGRCDQGRTALGRGNRETLASLCPAALEDQAAILGGHAHEKSMGASPALAVWLERTFHDVRSPATVERGRRNVNNSEPRQWVSIKAARGEMVGFVTVEIVCYSRLPCGTVGSPPEVFHNCGKKCGKATVFARSSTPRA